MVTTAADAVSGAGAERIAVSGRRSACCLAVLDACLHRFAVTLLVVGALLATMAYGSSAREHSTHAIPMADGTQLAADVFLPAPGRYPVVLEITPYGRGPEGINFRGEAGYWNAHGYAFVIVDARGSGDSAGDFAFFRNAGGDGRDVVAWLAEQAFSDGRVVMRGASYSGTNQLLTAAAGASALRCLAPAATGGPDPIDDVVYYDGVLHFTWALGWPTQLAGSPLPQRPRDWPELLDRGTTRGADEAALGMPSPLYRRFLTHGPGDPFWTEARLDAAGLARITQPVLMLTGWFDGTLDGTLEQFTALQAARPDARDRHLIVGPWVHETVADGGLDYLADYAPRRRVGAREFPPEAFLNGLELVRRFHDGCLGRGEGPRLPLARVYLTGSNRWLDLDDWPAPVAPRVLYLREGQAGSSGLLADAPGSGTVALVHDPVNPVPTGVFDEAGRFLHTGLQPVDPTPFLDRDGVHVFTSDPLEAPVTLLGTVLLELEVQSSAARADLVAWLAEVDADGRPIKLGARGPAIARVDTRSADPVPTQIEFSPVGHTLAAGHRLRLYLTTSAWPLTFPLPEAGTHHVRLGAPRGARLVLPVYAMPAIRAP